VVNEQQKMAIPPRKNKGQNKGSPKVLIRTKQNTRPNPKCKIMQWNTGGLSITKLTEIEHIIKEKDIDVLIVNEANIVAENTKYYNIQGFNNYRLPKSRQVASGIFAAVRMTKTPLKLLN